MADAAAQFNGLGVQTCFGMVQGGTTAFASSAQSLANDTAPTSPYRVVLLPRDGILSPCCLGNACQLSGGARGRGPGRPQHVAAAAEASGGRLLRGLWAWAAHCAVAGDPAPVLVHCAAGPRLLAGKADSVNAKATLESLKRQCKDWIAAP